MGSSTLGMLTLFGSFLEKAQWIPKLHSTGLGVTNAAPGRTMDSQ
jgi:hypothetical protein